MKYSFSNFQLDHMTMLVKPEMYNVAYIFFRVVFGCRREDVIYNVRKEWAPGQGEQSLTFAVRVGQGANKKEELNSAMIAMVQPTEPASQPSHVRSMLNDHKAAAHWQHLALRTPDLISFHKHCEDRGVNFITPILKDDSEDLIQVFTGEWFHPGHPASGLFFEFVQRELSPELVKMLEERNRQSFFRDKTFLGLYGEKEAEYQRGKVVPFIDPELHHQIERYLGAKKFWDISEDDIGHCERLMMEYASKKKK